MASRLLVATVKNLHTTSTRSLFVSSVRSCGWVRDWKPGPPPKTAEERVAAAKKYNLIPEDYIPYPDDEGMGDYPNLGKVGMDARDPYEDMDYYFFRRNYGEYIHIEGDLFQSDRHDPNETTRWSGPILLMQFIGMIAAGLALVYLCEYYDLKIMDHQKPKQYPGPGKVHYTFEPLD